MSHNNQALIMMTLLMSSGAVMAHIGDHHTMDSSELITHFLTQPVHLLWLLPLALLFTSLWQVQKRYAKKRKDSLGLYV